MAIYGIGSTPLINILIEIVLTYTENQAGVLAYADDFQAAENGGQFNCHWLFGYYLEPTKTWLMAKSVSF